MLQAVASTSNADWLLCTKPAALVMAPPLSSAEMSNKLSGLLFPCGDSNAGFSRRALENCCMSAHETASHHSHRGRVCLGAGVLHLQSRCCDCTTKHRAFYASCLCLQRKKCFHCVNQAMANPGYCFVYVFMSLSIYVSSATSRLLENAWVYTLPY